MQVTLFIIPLGQYGQRPLIQGEMTFTLKLVAFFSITVHTPPLSSSSLLGSRLKLQFAPKNSLSNY